MEEAREDLSGGISQTQERNFERNGKAYTMEAREPETEEAFARRGSEDSRTQGARQDPEGDRGGDRG